MFVYLCVRLPRLLASRWWVTDTDGGHQHQQAGWGQISSLLCLISPIPLPLSPRGGPVCNSTRFGKPHVLMEADHGLISSHSTTSGPSRLGAPREKGRGHLVGMSVWKQPCFEKVMLLSLSGTDFLIRSNFTPLNGALCKYIVICSFMAWRQSVEPPFSFTNEPFYDP